MARIRTIKPEFFTDSDIANLPALTRLFFVGLWCHADKAGRLKDKPRELKAKCLPYDDFEAEDGLVELADAKFITRYAVNGCAYIQVRTWDKHQKPHHTESESSIPSYNGYTTVKTPLDNGEHEFMDTPFPSLPYGREGQGVEEAGQELLRYASRLKALWNATPGLPAVRAMGKERSASFHARMKESATWWESVPKALEKVAASSFCRGNNDRGWKANLEWFLRPETMNRILEGKYDDRLKQADTPSEETPLFKP